MKIIRKFSIPEKWVIHSYYTVSPYAPDGSGRITVAGAELKTRSGAVYVLEHDGSVFRKFGEHKIESGFFHTGFWQTWSPDARCVYFQSGSLKNPEISRYDLLTEKLVSVAGDAEGAPPDGEPLVSGLMGMIYAAGYGYGEYNPKIAPVPFEERDSHGLFEYSFEPPKKRLALSVRQILDNHPERDKLLETDRKLADKNRSPAGLTLMTYCVRWNNDGTRLLFYFGNHCVTKERKEPRIACIFTCNRDFSKLRLALDMSQTSGVHWSWHPDGEHLIGYGNPPENTDKQPCMSIVRYDGTNFRKLCSHTGYGHPSISPADPDLMVTDNSKGEVVFWNIKKDTCISKTFFPAQHNFKPGRQSQRNETRVCHHPVFTTDGKNVLFNVLDGPFCAVYEAETGGAA